jgi:hypothetical protein
MSNTKEYVLVPKDEFQEMVEKYLYMLAGEAGGVDNWHYWGESISEFITTYNSANDTNFEDMDEVIEDFANSYETITKEE